VNSLSASLSVTCLVLGLVGCSSSAAGGSLLSRAEAAPSLPGRDAPSSDIVAQPPTSNVSLYGVDEGTDRAPVPPSDRGARRLGLWDVSGEFTHPVSAGRSVPAFRLSSEREEGTLEFVGNEAFVVVFFATWCELCVPKIEKVKRAMSAVPGARLLLVSVDDAKTASHVPGFLRERRLEQAPLVGGLEHPDFLGSYNPTSSLPAVTVVDRAGVLVETQDGLFDGDGRRLEAALARALAP